MRPAGGDLHQTLASKDPQSLPHRAAAHVERLADGVLVDLGARLERPGQDQVADIGHDLVGKAPPPAALRIDGRVLYVHCESSSCWAVSPC